MWSGRGLYFQSITGGVAASQNTIVLPMPLRCCEAPFVVELRKVLNEFSSCVRSASPPFNPDGWSERLRCGRYLETFASMLQPVSQFSASFFRFGSTDAICLVRFFFRPVLFHSQFPAREPSLASFYHGPPALFHSIHVPLPAANFLALYGRTSPLGNCGFIFSFPSLA